MKIGFYGGTANNLYVLAKTFTKYGVETIFIRDQGNLAPISQPVWEDVSFTLKFEDMSVSNWTKGRWDELETALEWKSPSWLIDPDYESHPSIFDHIKPSNKFDSWAFSKLLKKRPYWYGAIVSMNRCDLLFVCGAEATILAMMTGKPFVILPHGEDIRIAAGLQWPGFNNAAILKNHLLIYWLLRRAYRKALWVSLQDPKGVGGHIGDTISRLKNVNFKHFPMPYEMKPRVTKAERRLLLQKLGKSLGIIIPDAEFIGFIPSRVDFFWKGQDILIKAFQMFPGRNRMHLIFSGWGKDYSEASKIIQEQGMERSIIFLPFALSKPLLLEFFSTVDFVVDQFRLGTYGTSALEAMSHGSPVLMWIDEDSFIKKQWEPPPVLNAESSDEIAAVLNDIVGGQLNLEELGLNSMKWAQRVHSQDIVVNKFYKYMKEIEEKLVAANRKESHLA